MDSPSDAERLWRAAVALNRAAAAVSPEAAHLPPLLFFTDPVRTPRPWETAERLPPGAGVVFRAFGQAAALETGQRLRDATRTSQGVLLVGLDPELAEAVEADGLHLPEKALHQAGDLRRRRPDWLLTGAVHGATSVDLNAFDALVLSPVFPAGGASADSRPLGVRDFTRCVRRMARPVYALGGVGADQAEALSGSGACGVAAIQAVQNAFR